MVKIIKIQTQMPAGTDVDGVYFELLIDEVPVSGTIGRTALLLLPKTPDQSLVMIFETNISVIAEVARTKRPEVNNFVRLSSDDFR